MEDSPEDVHGVDGWRPSHPTPLSPNKFYYQLTSNRIITVDDEAAVLEAASDCMSMHGRPQDNLPPHLLVTRPGELKIGRVWHKAPAHILEAPHMIEALAEEVAEREGEKLLIALQTLLACGRYHGGLEIRQQLLNEHASLDTYPPGEQAE